MPNHIWDIWPVSSNGRRSSIRIRTHHCIDNVLQFPDTSQEYFSLPKPFPFSISSTFPYFWHYMVDRQRSRPETAPNRETKISFSNSIKIDDKFTSINAEPLMNRTFRGITIDWSDEDENASDSICVNREFDSTLIDESDLQHEKHFGPRISIFLPISIVDDVGTFRINFWCRTSMRKSCSIRNQLKIHSL
jgi:hypothetical protein